MVLTKGGMWIIKYKILELEKQQAEGYDRHPVEPGEFDVWVDEQAWGDE